MDKLHVDDVRVDVIVTAHLEAAYNRSSFPVSISRDAALFRIRS